MVEGSKSSLAKVALGFFTGLGGLTVPAITASFSTATIAARVSAQDDAPKVGPGAGEGKLLEFLVSLSETKGSGQPDSKVASRALKAIVEDLDSKKISDPTKPLAAAVFLGLLDPGSKAVVADHILRRLDAGESGPALKESLVTALRISLEGKGGAEKTASLLAKALSDDADERSAFEYLLKLIPDNETGSGAALARYATVALAAVSAEIPTQDLDPQLKDSLHLLIGKRPGGGELRKEEVVSVWRAVETLAQQDLEGGEAFVRQVLKSFLAPGDISSERKGAILCESPERFVRAAIPLIAGMVNTHSRDQLIAALPESVRQECERVVTFREDTNALLRTLQLAEPSRGFDPAVGWAGRDWKVLESADDMSFFKRSGDERRFQPGEEPNLADLLEAIDSRSIHVTHLMHISSLGEAVRTINELNPSDGARRRFVEIRTASAAQELAVLAREYTTGSINDGELLLGLVALSLQNPGTRAAHIAEGVVEPRLKEHGMERLWGYVSGREKFGEKEFESLLLDLPEMISVGPPDPIRTEVLGLMFRSLPEMPLYQAEFLSEVCLAKLSVIDPLHGEFFRQIALASPKMGLKIFEHYPTDASAVIREKLLRLVTDEVHRDKLIARLEPTVVDVFRSGDQGKLRDLFESEIHLHVCTARVIASALDHFESLEGDLSAQRRFFPRLDGMLWQTPADNDLLSAIPGIEAKLFEMLSRVQEYGLKGGGLVTALVHLSLNGQIDGLDEKLRARICDAESDEDTLDLCLYGLSRLPVTQANFECVLSHAKLWRDQGRLDLVSSAANSLQFQSGTVPVWTDLGDVKGRLFDLLTVADDDTQFLVGKALVKLDDSGHIQGLRHDLHLRLVDPNQSNQAKVVDLSILNALPVDSDTLNVLVELLECLSEDDTSKLAHEVFSGVGKMIGQAPRGLDVREPQRRWLERGCTILKESAAESDQFKFTRHTLLERSKTCKEAQDASLILVGAIEALKPKGSLEIMELLCRSDFLKKADITPDLMGCYVDLIAECVRAPLHSDAAPDRSILLRSEFDNRLANVLKSDIFESLLKLGKGSTEMKEVLEQKCAAIETALARERQQGEGVESERITILQDLHRGLSSFLTWRKTLER